MTEATGTGGRRRRGEWAATGSCPLVPSWIGRMKLHACPDRHRIVLLYAIKREGVACRDRARAERVRSERDAGVSDDRHRGKSHERSKRAHSEHRDRENGDQLFCIIARFTYLHACL